MPPDSGSANGGQTAVVHTGSTQVQGGSAIKPWRTAPPLGSRVRTKGLSSPRALSTSQAANLTTIQATRTIKRSLPTQIAGAQLPPVQQPQGFVAGTSIILSRSQPCTPILIPHKPTPTQVTLQGVRHITHIPQRSPPASNAQPRSPAPRMATVPAAPTPTVPYSGAAASLLLGTRVTITNSQGSRSGKVVDVHTINGKHKVCFDQGVCEWLTLPACGKWAWQTPRAQSAGLTPALCTALRKLGCSNLLPEPHAPRALPANVVPAPPPATPEAAVGRHLWLYCPASGRWTEGVVMAVSQAGTGAHHVVYADGAEEWVTLNHEVVVWTSANSNDKRFRHILPQNLPGVPEGEAAVNWRVAVYWPGDQTFFNATITKYRPETKQHELLYDDGDEEDVRLDDQRMVLWRCRIRDPGDVKLTSTTRRRTSGGGSANKRQRTSKSGAARNRSA